MATWGDIEREQPGLAAAARRFLEGRVHRTLATLRADGAPRISGTEIRIHEGEVWFGSMWRSHKALDLLRDPRFALHSGSEDPPGWSGDATVAGLAVEDDAARIPEIFGQASPGPAHLFRADITELTVVTMGDPADHLVLESWVLGRGYRRRTRT